MSTYDDSSLFLYPSGYKASVLFAQKPMDANGQLAFTRSNDTATRVDENLLIEKVRTNLNPNGNLVGLALNTNPTGYTNFNTGTFEPVTNTTSSVGTFCKFTTSGTRGFLERTFTGLTIGQPYAFSYKVQAISGSLNLNQTFSFFSGATTSSFYMNGVASPVGTNAVTTGLIYVVGVATSTSISIRIGSGVAGVTTAVFEIGNFQLESGDIATPYIATTTTAVSVGPLANIPRIDYLGGGCGKLLLEPQRTNLVTFSEQFDNAAWTKFNSSVSANQVISPDGYLNADKLIPNTVAASHQINVSVTGAAHTLSIFAKAGEYSTLALFYTVHDGRAVFNLSNGTITETTGTVTSRIEDYGNGWYRCILSTTLTTHNAIRIYAINGTTWADVSTAGNGTSGIFIYGAQLEAGSYASSYVNTLAASVTRGADACSKTGISSLIGQTEGTIYLEADIQKYAETGFSIAISDGATLANAIYLNRVASGNLQVLVRKSGNPDGTIIISSANWTAGLNKVAIAYTATTAEVFVNGSSKGTVSFISAPTCSQFAIGSRPDSVGTNVGTGPYNQAILFKTRLPNSELSSLTTL